MSISLLLIAFLFAFLSGFGVIFVSLRFFLPRIKEHLETEEQKLEEALSDIFFTDFTPHWILYLKYGVPVIIAFLFFAGGQTIFGLALAVAIYLSPNVVLEIKSKKRRKRLEEQVHDLIRHLGANVRSGSPLPKAIEDVAQKFPKPMSEEFDMICQRLDAGQTLSQALQEADTRLAIPNLSLVFRSIVVREDSGGNLVELLETLAVSLREIAKVEEKVENETSGIKLSSKLMAAMPILMTGILFLISPDNVVLLFKTIPGNIVVVLSIILTYTGFRMINKLADIDA